MNVALAQLTPTPDPLAGCSRIRKTVNGAPEADLIVFPELFVGGYTPDDLASRSLEVGDPAIADIRASCREHRTAVVFGCAESLGTGHGFANSAIGIDRDGSVAGVYRKTHLFGPDEQTAFRAGESLRLMQLAGRSVGPQICFDTEFPEPSRELALAGADLLITVAANMEPYGADHRLAVRARALDNRLPHLYVNRTGSEAGHRFVGESCVVSPGGEVTAELGSREGILKAEIPDPAPGRDANTRYLDQIRPGLTVATPDSSNGEEL